MLTVLSLLPMLGAGAVIVLAQLQVKERSERAALALTIGGGLEVAAVFAREFTSLELLRLASPLTQLGAVGGVVYGLLTLVNELNPKRATPLPVLLANHQEVKPNIPLLVTFAFFGMVGVINGSMAGRPLMSVTAMVAIVGALAGSVWVERQGPLARWVLERRPDLVVWSYVYQLRVVNRRSGSSVTHWSAQLGLSTGALVPLPASTEQHAQTLVAAVGELSPGLARGFSAENSTRFKSSPEAMGAGVRP